MVVRPLSPELQEEAEKELQEVPCRVEEDINRIREWISKQPHLNARTDDQWLLSFLRGCKFSLEQTKEKIDTYYSLRSIEPKVFSNRDPFLPDIQELIKLGAGVILPKSALPTGPRIVIVWAKHGLFMKYPPETLFKALFMMLDILLNDDNFVVAGVHIILDLKGFRYEYLAQLPLYFMKRGIMLAQEIYPVRVKGAHIINFPSYLEPIFNAAKMLLKKKLAQRINIYAKENMDELYKIIPLSLLPKDYGGEERCMDDLILDNIATFESYKDWFREDAQYLTDETKRLGKRKTVSETSGIEGSFRQLELD